MRPAKLALALILLIASFMVKADPIIVGGQITGFDNLNVNGTLYDVIFVEGTCIDVFDGCDDASDFDFQNFADAFAAGQALVDTVFAGLTEPAAIFGCENLSGNANVILEGTCLAATPYQTPADRGDAFVGQVTAGFPEDLLAAVGLPPVFDDIQRPTDDFGDPNQFPFANALTWARWTPSQPVPVPEPSALALFGIGLFGIGLARRRKKV